MKKIVSMVLCLILAVTLAAAALAAETVTVMN